MREIDAAQWDACANPEAVTLALGPRTRDGDPHMRASGSTLYIACFPEGTRDIKSIGPRWLDQHAYPCRDPVAVSPPPRQRLFENPFYGRICIRSWLDAYHGPGCVLSKVASGRPLHASHRPNCSLPQGMAKRQRKKLIAGLRVWRENAGTSSRPYYFPTRTNGRRSALAVFYSGPGSNFISSIKAMRISTPSLADLASRKRKTIRRERKGRWQRHRDRPVDRRPIFGNSIGTLFRFYMDTGARKWGAPISIGNFSRVWARR